MRAACCSSASYDVDLDIHVDNIYATLEMRLGRAKRRGK